VHSQYWTQLRELNLQTLDISELEAILDGPNLTTLRILTVDEDFCRCEGNDVIPQQDEAAALLARCPYLADGLELQISSKGLSEAGRRLLRDRFGDGLMLYPADSGAHRQREDWASGRPPRSAFDSEQDALDKGP
jgi:hypothetical protein